jgi:hypothetical protein
VCKIPFLSIFIGNQMESQRDFPSYNDALVISNLARYVQLYFYFYFFLGQFFPVLVFTLRNFCQVKCYGGLL